MLYNSSHANTREEKAKEKSQKLLLHSSRKSELSCSLSIFRFCVVLGVAAATVAAASRLSTDAVMLGVEWNCHTMFI